MASLSKLRGKARHKKIAATHYCATDNDAGGDEGGGGGAPVTKADFKNGVYLVNDATVAVTDMFKSDPDGWGSNFNAGDITADGYPSGAINAAGAFLATILQGCTLRLKIGPSLGGTFNEILVGAYDGPDFNADKEAAATQSGIRLNNTFAAAIDLNLETANTVVVVITADRLSVSVNGSEAATTAEMSDGVWGDVAEIAFSFERSQYLESIEVLPVAADADLPALSALS